MVVLASTVGALRDPATLGRFEASQRIDTRTVAAADADGAPRRPIVTHVSSAARRGGTRDAARDDGCPYEEQQHGDTAPPAAPGDEPARPPGFGAVVLDDVLSAEEFAAFEAHMRLLQRSVADASTPDEAVRRRAPAPAAPRAPPRPRV